MNWLLRNLPAATGFSLAATLVTNGMAADSSDSKRLRLAAYLPDYRVESVDLGQTQHITDLLLFSAQPGANGEIDLHGLAAPPWEPLHQLRDRKRIRLILCLGGWGRSDGFPAIATNNLLQAKFVHNALKLCEQRRLDGLDLDWEHPKNRSEEEGYAALLSQLHSSLHPRGLSLSVTIAAWQRIPRSAWKSVDWVHLMAYDHSGKHATFEGATNDVQRLLDAGVPAAKLILGLPFYGRDPQHRERTLSYAEILTKYHPAPDVDEIDGFYFNGPVTLRRKIEFAKKMRLGGVMIWELGQDAPGESSLLKVAANALNAH